MADALRVNNIHFGNVASNHNQAHIGFTSIGIGSTANYGALQFVGVPNTLCWTANGTVGIGTTNPQGTLDINGIVHNTAIVDNFILNVRAPDSYNGNGGITVYSNSINLRSGDLIWSGTRVYGAQIYIGGGYSINAAVNHAPIILTTANTERMRIAGNGNVGIGTANPSFTLDVVGNIRATGSITSASTNIIPTGIIVMWSGSVSNVPAGWVLCNGTNSTPDLRNRFIVGAGSTYTSSEMGGSNTVTLSIGNLPSHTHTVPDHTHTVPNHTHTTPDHTHSISDNGHFHDGGAVNYGLTAARGGDYGGYTQVGNTLSKQTGITINNGGGGTSGGSGTLTSGGSGTLTSGGAGSGTAITIIPLYYALCYIMKT